MWVQETDPLGFDVDQKIAVRYAPFGPLFQGVYKEYRSLGNNDWLFYFTTDDGREMSATSNRIFYRWEEDEPAKVDESKLRLNNPERAKKLHAHVGEIIDEQQMAREVEDAETHLRRRIERLEDKLNSTVIVGRHAFKLTPGDHLRVWWEDGSLFTELVQG